MGNFHIWPSLKVVSFLLALDSGILYNILAILHMAVPSHVKMTNKLPECVNSSCCPRPYLELFMREDRYSTSLSVHFCSLYQQLLTARNLMVEFIRNKLTSINTTLWLFNSYFINGFGSLSHLQTFLLYLLCL